MRARDNPFATDRVLAVRYRPLEGSWDELMARLAALEYRAAIIGPEGSGKTTLLEDLAPRLEALGFTVRSARLDRGSGSLPAGLLDGLSGREIILLDSTEQLGRLAWRRLRRRSARAAGLVLTAHRPGLLPTLVECRTSPELLEEIVGRLAGDGVAEDGRLACPGRPRSMPLGELFRAHRGNIREALRELYDLCAASASPLAPDLRGSPATADPPKKC